MPSLLLSTLRISKLFSKVKEMFLIRAKFKEDCIQISKKKLAYLALE
jgi:hypothetical protein